ncbi:ester cyclase [Streptomyces sp. NPDC004539]|uniref:nuclear transport factor 2 family protein n=1 Tax=Streptomyces sp. NPDC004539 TaxID=3154280 RepID=UPI0033B12305
MSDAGKNREIVVRFYESLFNEGDLSVVDELVGDVYVDHQPMAGDGPDALKGAITAIRAANPGMRVSVERALAEDDLVLLHVDAGTHAVAGIFRVEDGKVVEHWEAMQPVPAGSDMFSSAGRSGGDSEDSRRTVLAFFDAVTVERDLGAFDRYLGELYIEHNPDTLNGADASREKFAGAFAALPELRISRKRVIADGDLVAVHHHFQAHADDRGAACVEIFRVAGGRIVEHWDVVQPVPEVSANEHTMF